MAEISDEDLKRMEVYGPSGGLGEARALIGELRRARAELARAREVLARPAVASAVEECERELRRSAALSVLAELGDSTRVS